MPTAHPIEGNWLPFKAELGGQAAPAMALQSMRLTLRAGQYWVRFASDIHDRGRYEISESGALLTITLQGDQGVNRGRKIPAIFQLAGDRLRICYGLDGCVPDAFATGSDEQRYLVTYRREEG